jgi:predicted DNA-binding transcriptional regulator
MALEIVNDIFLTTKKQTKIKNHNIYIYGNLREKKNQFIHEICKNIVIKQYNQFFK